MYIKTINFWRRKASHWPNWPLEDLSAEESSPRSPLTTYLIYSILFYLAILIVSCLYVHCGYLSCRAALRLWWPSFSPDWPSAFDFFLFLLFLIFPFLLFLFFLFLILYLLVVSFLIYCCYYYLLFFIFLTSSEVIIFPSFMGLLFVGAR